MATVASHSQFRFDHFHLANRKVDVNKERKRNEFQVVEKLRVVHVDDNLILVSFFLMMIALVQRETAKESRFEVIDYVRLPVETLTTQSPRR